MPGGARETSCRHCLRGRYGKKGSRPEGRLSQPTATRRSGVRSGGRSTRQNQPPHNVARAAAKEAKQASSPGRKGPKVGDEPGILRPIQVYGLGRPYRAANSHRYGNIVAAARTARSRMANGTGWRHAVREMRGEKRPSPPATRGSGPRRTVKPICSDGRGQRLWSRGGRHGLALVSITSCYGRTAPHFGRDARPRPAREPPAIANRS